MKKHNYVWYVIKIVCYLVKCMAFKIAHLIDESNSKNIANFLTFSCAAGKHFKIASKIRTDALSTHHFVKKRP